MKILEELFHIYEENSYSKVVEESWKKCAAELNTMPDESVETIKNLIHAYASECEKASFKNGFYYGISLMIEFVCKDNAFNGNTFK